MTYHFRDCSVAAKNVFNFGQMSSTFHFLCLSILNSGGFMRTGWLLFGSLQGKSRQLARLSVQSVFCCPEAILQRRRCSTWTIVIGLKINANKPEHVFLLSWNAVWTHQTLLCSAVKDGLAMWDYRGLDLWPPKSNQFIHESQWIFGPNFVKISLMCSRDIAFIWIEQTGRQTTWKVHSI